MQRHSIKNRFSKSISWPLYVKVINGLTWALPFILIPFFHKYYPFLLLTGLSFGNLSTFVFLKKYSKILNLEQIITGSLIVFSLIYLLLYYNYSNDYELLLFYSRILISISYGAGGVIGYFKNIEMDV